MQKKDELDMNSKSEINELLDMFDLEPISENDKPNVISDKEVNIYDDGNNYKRVDEVSSVERGKNIKPIIIAFVLVVITILGTLFVSESYFQNKYNQNNSEAINQSTSEFSEAENGSSSLATGTSVNKTAKMIQREFINDPDVFVSYYDRINYYDMTLLYEEGDLLAITPRIDNVFLMSEPKADSLQMVNMYLKETDYAGIVGIYNNYLHVYFPIDGYEYYGWVRMGDVEFYSLDENNVTTYMSSDAFESLVKEKLVEPYYSSSNENTSINESQSDNSTSGVELTSGYFTIGSTFDDVLAIMGTPDSINDYGINVTWNYGISTVNFENGIVVGFDNYENNLLFWIGDQVPGYIFSIGYSTYDVINANGTPTAITYYGTNETWWYGISTIAITNGLVTGYDNYDNNLNVYLGSAISGYTFGIGSSKDDVISANGTPTGVSDYGYYETWYYGLSSVSFDGNDLVEAYDNWDGNLNISF